MLTYKWYLVYILSVHGVALWQQCARAIVRAKPRPLLDRAIVHACRIGLVKGRGFLTVRYLEVKLHYNSRSIVRYPEFGSQCPLLGGS